jgi:hypothetical protein
VTYVAFMLAPVFFAAVLAAHTPAAAPAPSATPSPTPQRLLGMIRAQFRSHRPPPPYETYTLVRKQVATNGYPDPVGSYTVHIWVRNYDKAALTRKVFRDFARGDMTFDRPAFNEDRDPGPPTADVFEPAPLHKHPVSDVPTPEPNYTPLPIIGGVRTLVELDYRVVSVETIGDELHVSIEPTRDVDRNRLREIYCDKNTLELHKLIATDKLFTDPNPAHAKIYPVTFTITMSNVEGYPVVTSIHGIVGGGYNDDGKEVDFTFSDIKFPKSLPDWYFDPRSYAQHLADAPQ